MFSKSCGKTLGKHAFAKFPKSLDQLKVEVQCKVAFSLICKLPNPEMNSNDDQAKLKLPRKNVRKITLAVRNLEPAKHNQMSCSIENQGYRVSYHAYKLYTPTIF